MAKYETNSKVVTRIRTYFNTNNWINLFLAEGQKSKYRNFLFVERLEGVQRTAGALKRPNIAFIASNVLMRFIIDYEKAAVKAKEEARAAEHKKQLPASSSKAGLMNNIKSTSEVGTPQPWRTKWTKTTWSRCSNSALVLIFSTRKINLGMS